MSFKASSFYIKTKIVSVTSEKIIAARWDLIHSHVTTPIPPNNKQTFLGHFFVSKDKSPGVYKVHLNNV